MLNLLKMAERLPGKDAKVNVQRTVLHNDVFFRACKCSEFGQYLVSSALVSPALSRPSPDLP